MKYRVTHTESGEEVHVGDVLTDHHGRKFEFEGVSRGPDQCEPHQTCKIVATYVGNSNQILGTTESYASVFGLEITEDTRRAFKVVITVDRTKGDYQPFTVGDVEVGFTHHAWPYGCESGALKFEVEEIEVDR